MTRVQNSRHSSPTKVQAKPSVTPGSSVKSPASQRKWTPSPGPTCSPLLTRDKRSSSCKDNFDYEESLALAMAMSKSIYLESPLPVIPGLSSVAAQHDVLAHPHRDVSKVKL